MTETCKRCGRHDAEVPLSEVGDVCVRCEQILLEEADRIAADATQRLIDDDYERNQSWGPI
jgi:hypothetical protein